MKSHEQGLQLPGGPFVQVGHVGENCWSRWATVHDTGTTVVGAQLDFNTNPELTLEMANTLAELAGSLRAMAEAALDHRAQLREVTF